MAIANRVICGRCESEVQLLLERIDSEATLEHFMLNEDDRGTCPSCQHALDQEPPRVVIRDDLLGVVLANPEPCSLDAAVKVMELLLGDLLAQEPDDPRRIMVVGRAEELRRLLRAERQDVFNAARFDRLASRAWENEVEALKVLVDACLQADRPESAYWLLIEAVGWFNELYFDPEIFRLLEATATMGGDRIAANLKEPRTALEDFGRVKPVLEPLRPETPSWFRRAFLCFFHPGIELNELKAHVMRNDAVSMRVDRVGFDKDSRPDFEGAELHVDHYPSQAIGQEKPSLIERCMLQMCVIGLTPGIADLLKDLDELDAIAFQSCIDVFHGNWSLITSDGRYQLYKKYQAVSGGRDLVMDFNLQPKGIYLTIARKEPD